MRLSLFECITKHAGEEQRKNLTRVHEVDENDDMVATHADEERIEEAIMKCNN